MTTVKVGQRGTIVIPADIRDRLGMAEGSLVLVEERNGSLVIRPAIAIPVEEYSLRRKAELLLNNAVDDQDYERLREEVRSMGIDPDDVPHHRP